VSLTAEPVINTGVAVPFSEAHSLVALVRIIREVLLRIHASA
jgi:hypothetical protein